MLEELSKEIKAQLYDRAKSPLFGGFIIAWLGWNLRAILVLFSELKYAEKIIAWEAIYPSSTIWLLNAIVFPLLSAVLFILVYPHPARWIFGYWYSQHKKLKAIQQKIEDETPLTQAEAIVLRRTAVEDQVAAQKRMTELAAQNREIEERNTALLGSMAELERDRDDARNLIVTLEEKLQAMKSQPEAATQEDLSTMLQGTYSEPTADSFPLAPKNDRPKPNSLEGLLSSINDEVKHQLVLRLPMAEDRRVMAVFLAIVAAGGAYLTVSNIVSLTDANRVDVQYGWDKLLKAGAIQEIGGSQFELTELAQDLAVQLDLTNSLPILKKAKQ